MRCSTWLLLVLCACTRTPPASERQAPTVTNPKAPTPSEAAADARVLDAGSSARVEDASVPLYEEERSPAPSYPSLAAFCKAWAVGPKATCAERPMPVALAVLGDAGSRTGIKKLHAMWLHDASSERMTMVAQLDRGFRRTPIDWTAIAYDDATPPWSPDVVEALSVRGPWLVARMAGLVFPPTQVSGTPGAPEGSYRFRYVRSFVWCRHEGDEAICRSHAQRAPEAAWKEQTAAWLAKKPWSAFEWSIGSDLEVDERGSLVVR